MKPRFLGKPSLRQRLPLGLLVALPTCGGPPPAPPPPPAVETPADEILRIGERWNAATEQRGLLSPPSAISVFVVREESRISLSPESAREELTIQEEVELRDGGTVRCQARFEHELGIKWGRRDDTAAVELRRPALRAPRSCDGAHPEPTLTREGGPVRYLLRSDQLVAVEPPRENRVYIPLP